MYFIYYNKIKEVCICKLVIQIPLLSLNGIVTKLLLGLKITIKDEIYEKLFIFIENLNFIYIQPHLVDN